MASPGELVRRLSQVTGINEATVTSTHRYLRDNGLITKGGRGTSSAKMSTSDATNIIIAVLAATAINDSPDVVERYGQLQIGNIGGTCEIDDLWAEGEPKTFAVCVRKIFEFFQSGRIAEAISNVGGKKLATEDLNFMNIDISIGITRPEPEGFVRLNAIITTDENAQEITILDLLFERQFGDRNTRQKNIHPPIVKSEMRAGLQERRWIDLKVVSAIAEIL